MSGDKRGFCVFAAVYPTLHTPHKYDGVKIYGAGSGAEARTVMSVSELAHSHSPDIAAGGDDYLSNGSEIARRKEPKSRHQVFKNVNSIECAGWRAKSRPKHSMSKEFDIDKRIFMHRTLMITHHP